jgi:hypothetical protein
MHQLEAYFYIGGEKKGLVSGEGRQRKAKKEPA